MRFLRVALGIACLSVAHLRAADQEEEKQQPEEIPDFNQIDEYTYVPKSTLSIATRLFLTGPKTSYSGQGQIPSAVDAGTNTAPNVSHTYYDGTVDPDTRSTIGSNGVGQTYSVPIAPDGRTNTWSYSYASQLQPNGDIAFHTYSGYITDTDSHYANGTPSVGLELLWDRDMGKLGKHFKWAITAGFSISDIHSSVYASVPTTLNTLTDTYDLFGQVPPTAPFSSPNSISQSVYNSSGSVVTGTTSGSGQTQEVDQTILLGNMPTNRTIAATTEDTINRYFIEGAYYTLRIGPTLIMPLGKHFKFSLSVGPDVLYSGSELNVLENLTFDETTTSVPQLYQKFNTKILPGYYADVDLRYDFTETAGLYVGAIYEGSGSYTQSVPSGVSLGSSASSSVGTSYSTKIDFADQEGVKAGMTFRF
jgi:hypothetical protein